VLQRVAACCSLLQRVAAFAACCGVLQRAVLIVQCFLDIIYVDCWNLRVAACCSVLQRVAECVVERRSVMQRAAVYAVYYSVFQRVVACCVTSSLFPTNNLSLVLRPESAAG